MSDRSDDAAWDKVWTDDPYALPALRSERARSKVAAFIAVGLKIEAQDRVLDLACGSGQTLIEALTKTSHRGGLVACDISTAAIRLARENFNRAGFNVEVFCPQPGQLPLRDE